MKVLLSSLFLFSCFIISSATAADDKSELLENGDFPSETIGAWRINVSNHHGVNPQPYVKDGALGFAKCESSKGPYFTLSQAVEIQEGKNYTLSFEVRGKVTSGKISARVGMAKPDTLGLKNHTRGKTFEITEEWVIHSVEFTGTYDTESDFVKENRKAYKKNSLKKPVKRADIKDIKYRSGEGPTSLAFGLGSINAKNLEIRNVSIKENAE